MPEVDIFYGITTTTLVVLSSATLVVFQQLINSIQSSAKLCEESIKELDSKEKICDEEILDILGNNSEILSSEYKNISANIWENFALFLVIFLSAISIFLTLLSGVFDISFISTKRILSVNLASISIYLFAFLSMLKKVHNKKKSLKTITTKSEMFIKSINDTEALYRILNKNKGEFDS